MSDDHEIVSDDQPTIAEQRAQEEVTVDLRGCARCHGEGHPQLTFRKLTFPFEPDVGDEYTHWAPCPANGEPILMIIKSRDEIQTSVSQPVEPRPEDEEDGMRTKKEIRP